MVYQLTFHQENNNNGRILVNFAASGYMGIDSTVFEHKNIHKIKWRSPNGQYFNQFNHIFIDSRHISNLMMLELLDVLVSAQMTSRLFHEYDAEYLTVKRFKQ
jgi:hypothetical protein